MSSAAYGERVRSLQQWGGAIEIAIFAKLFGKVVEVYQTSNDGGFDCISTFNGEMGVSQPIRLLYEGGVHYDLLLQNC